MDKDPFFLGILMGICIGMWIPILVVAICIRIFRKRRAQQDSEYDKASS